MVAMDLRIRKEDRELQEKAREFTEKYLYPVEVPCDERGGLPAQTLDRLKKLVIEWQLNAINQPREHGGQGYSIFQQTLINEELGKTSCGLWQLAWQPGYPLRHGTAEQIRDYLVPSCEGRRRGCFAITEEGAGSDPRGIATIARRRNGKYYLSGEKWHVTCGDVCDFMNVLAKVDGDADRLTLFLVDKSRAGVRVRRAPKYMHSFVFKHLEMAFDEVPRLLRHPGPPRGPPGRAHRAAHPLQPHHGAELGVRRGPQHGAPGRHPGDLPGRPALVPPRLALDGGAMMRLSLGSALLWSFAGLVCLFLVLPSLIVVPMSFNADNLIRFPPRGFSFVWYETYFARENWRMATVNSLAIAILTTALATSLGTLAAYGLVRGRIPLRNLFIFVMLMPMIVPPIVSAVSMYGVFAPLNLVGTIAGMALAHTVLALPFVMINVSAVLQRMDWRAEQAARSLGASATRAFLLVTLPLIRPGIIAGAIFAFITSFDEVVVALFLSGSNAVTLPVQMWSGLRFEINPVVASVSTMLIGLSVAGLAAMNLLRRKT
jgi:putative spermidine/putrescine transport system permease protein